MPAFVCSPSTVLSRSSFTRLHTAPRHPAAPTLLYRSRRLQSTRRPVKSTASTGDPVRAEAASHELEEGYRNSIIIDGRPIFYDYFSGDGPTIVFLPGFFYSRWHQAKANALEIFAKRKGQAILVEEYIGTSEEDGNFARDGTLSRWIVDTVELIDRLPGKVVLVGAGIGGWIMLHAAMKRPDTVVGLVGINPSVDFTHGLVLPSMTEDQKELMRTEGVVDIKWGFHNYKISQALMDDATKWLVLKGGSSSIDVSCPIRLLQGLSDEEVPATRILELVDVIKSTDCVVSFIKHGDHFLEEESDFLRMWGAICEMSATYYEYDLTTPGSG